MHLHAEQGRTSPSTSTGMPSDQDGSAAVRNNLGHHALPLMEQESSYLQSHRSPSNETGSDSG
jgi:hypothetical protein